MNLTCTKVELSWWRIYCRENYNATHNTHMSWKGDNHKNLEIKIRQPKMRFKEILLTVQKANTAWESDIPQQCVPHLPNSQRHHARGSAGEALFHSLGGMSSFNVVSRRLNTMNPLVEVIWNSQRTLKVTILSSFTWVFAFVSVFRKGLENDLKSFREVHGLE